MYNTRIAPSPTGPTHIGTLRTAYFNWLAARSTGGKFIIRIDDTDRVRSDDQYIDQFLDAMDWLGLDWDDVYHQSIRLPIYRKYAQTLIDLGLAIDDKQNYCTRLNLDAIPDIKSWNDSVCGDIPIRHDNSKGFDRMVLIGSDGMPTYHFSTVVDDIDLDIDFVIRGVDHLTNTAKHVLLYNLFGHKTPKYAHVGLICNKGKKLSKRDNDSSVQKYMLNDINPDAMLNFLARMGWGPKVDDRSTRLLPKKKMLKLFLDGGNMRSSPANIDINKLNSFDRKYKALISA